MRIREMCSDDLPFALGLTSAEGWMSTELDFQEILTHDPRGSFIGEIGGQSVGMVCTVAYDRFGFIGNLIVIPEQRGRGLGEELMVYAMRYLRNLGLSTHMLDGVAKAIPLYERLGFRKVSKSLRLEGRSAVNQVQGSRAMLVQDIEMLSVYDEDCFGSNRRVFLQNRFDNFPNLCFVSQEGSTVNGYIMGSESGDVVRIGPWVVTEDDGTADALLSSLLAAAPNRTIRVGVLESNEKALRVLQSHGFRQISFSWRMSTSPEEDWSCSRNLFAICSPARG